MELTIQDIVKALETGLHDGCMVSLAEKLIGEGTIEIRTESGQLFTMHVREL